MPVEDPYDRYKDISSTPFLDLCVGLLLVASICGGGLGAIYAAGYFANDNAKNAWPLTIVVVVLLVANIALRILRAQVRKRR